jgi:hypothetical protein
MVDSQPLRVLCLPVYVWVRCELPLLVASAHAYNHRAGFFRCASHASRQVLQNMPIKDAKVAASWRVRGAPVNALHIMPHYKGLGGGKEGGCPAVRCVVCCSLC